MPTLSDLGTELPQTDVEMTYLEKNNINESIRQNLKKNYVYQSDTHNIYNLIVGPKKWTTTREGGIRRHLPVSQDLPRPNMLPDYTKEALLLK